MFLFGWWAPNASLKGWNGCNPSPARPGPAVRNRGRQYPPYGRIVTVKIYPLFSVTLVAAAFGQTPAPKTSPPPSLAPPPPQHATPGQLATPPAGPLESADPNRVVATIGDDKITAGEFNAIVEALTDQFKAQGRGPGKRQFMEQLVMIKVMAKQARDMHMDERPAVKQQIDFAKENIL